MNHFSYRNIRSKLIHKSPGDLLTTLTHSSIAIFLGILGISFVFGSCNMINEDLDPCAPPPGNYTVVDFVYDYNMLDEDLFYDHVGSVYLYIFDNDGIYRFRRELHKEFMKPGEDFSMTFSEKELIPGETYDFVAVAQGNGIGNDQSEEYNWFKLVNPLTEGVSTIEDYILRLDRDTNEDGFSEVGVINYKDQYGQNQQMIDTLWTTKPDEVQRVTIKKNDYIPSKHQQPDIMTHVTVPMMRITNSITVNVINKSFTTATDPNDYHVIIHFPNGNGTVDFTGTTLPAQELYYQSLIKKMVIHQPKEYLKEAGSLTENRSTRADEETYAMQSLFGVSRLQVNDDSSLQLRDAKKDGYPIIFEIPNFSETLAQMLNSSQWGDQEFLDREYDFTVDIGLEDDNTVTWIAVSISTLSWAVREWYLHF